MKSEKEKLERFLSSRRPWTQKEAARQKLEEKLIERSDGKKPLKARLKEWVRGSDNFERMQRTEKARRKKVKKNKNREATQRNARNKTKHM